ncbi:Ribonuclease H-like superfamily protein [Gossypium australe]|uniref:Ribonuclease H-like superfamily protein n=1 Tax=Gossypium australe TaxID=47621 RepID=A0A5B6V949_9ROSI|nr:Ribonuclease H-like superfamily protein [Gossypium australe]
MTVGFRDLAVACQNMNIRFTQVSDLIDKETNTWKQDIIRSLLGEEQMERILTIPLASSRPREELVWRGDNTGVYTAKSGYRWLITEGGTRIQNEIPTNFFTKLWELQMPSKICILMWKISNKYLPTLHNLKVRQLTVNPLCPGLSLHTSGFARIRNAIINIQQRNQLEKLVSE